MTNDLTAGVRPAISVQDLAKDYGERRAVDGVTFEVARGEVCGFVGPNGAGKSTTIRMLLGLVRPTSGRGEVLGHSIADPAGYLHKVGAMIEGPAFYPGLTGRRNLQVLAALGGLHAVDLDGLLARVGLAGRGESPYRSYSLGMKQRLGIAAALLSDPELLVLDEPTNGLDPAGIAEIRELLKAIAGEGRTVFVSSHLLSEIESIADRVVFLHAGRLIFCGSTTELLSATRTRTVAVPDDPAELIALTDVVRRLGLPARVDLDLGGLEIDTSDSALINLSAHEDGINLASVQVVRPTLEETFLALTGASETPAAPALAMTA